jgi:hypothetical protein
MIISEGIISATQSNGSLEFEKRRVPLIGRTNDNAKKLGWG